jgi:hypothetical protein
VKLLHTRHDQPEPVIEEEPLLSPAARRFLDGDLTADQYLGTDRYEAERELDHGVGTDRQRDFIRVLAILMSLMFGITAFFLSWARGPAAGIGALGLSASLLAIAQLASRR